MNIKTTSLSKRIKDIGGSTTEEWRVGHMEWDKVEGQPQNKRKRCRPQLEGDPTTTNKQSMEGQKKKKKTDGLDIPSLAKLKTTHVRPR
jgi:hypothetical protein